MPRPSKSRRVCRAPRYAEFFAKEAMQEKDRFVRMSVEEYETIRLMDYMGLTQAEAAEQMQVSRATVQVLYTEARKKMARFLVEGISMQISGGDYELCGNGMDGVCGHCAGEAQAGKTGKSEVIQMKIAVTYENGQVFQHFGHTEQFKVYNVEDGKIVSTEVVDTNGQGHGALAGFLFGGGVDVLICGGIGGGARNALAEAGIELYPGAMGDADAQVESFLAGKLVYDPNTTCNHHDHEHGEGGCGDHEGGCGHHCG